MKIVPVMKGSLESTDHIFLINKDALNTVMEVFTDFCNTHKNKSKAKKMLKQFENELQIY